MSAINSAEFETFLARMAGFEERVERLDARLTVLETRACKALGMQWCARCETYREKGYSCPDEFCALRGGSDFRGIARPETF